jgi:hypothetical protein
MTDCAIPAINYVDFMSIPPVVPVVCSLAIFVPKVKRNGTTEIHVFVQWKNIMHVPQGNCWVLFRSGKNDDSAAVKTLICNSNKFIRVADRMNRMYIWLLFFNKLRSNEFVRITLLENTNLPNYKMSRYIGIQYKNVFTYTVLFLKHAKSLKKVRISLHEKLSLLLL